MNQSVKIYQIAADIGLDNELVVQRARALGLEVRNPMSKVTTDDAERIKNALQKDKQDEWVEVQLPDGVIKRVKRPRPAAPVEAYTPPAPAPYVAPYVEPSPPVAKATPQVAVVERTDGVVRVDVQPEVVAAPPPAVAPVEVVSKRPGTKPRAGTADVKASPPAKAAKDVAEKTLVQATEASVTVVPSPTVEVAPSVKAIAEPSPVLSKEPEPAAMPVVTNVAATAPSVAPVAVASTVVVASAEPVVQSTPVVAGPVVHENVSVAGSTSASEKPAEVAPVVALHTEPPTSREVPPMASSGAPRASSGTAGREPQRADSARGEPHRADAPRTDAPRAEAESDMTKTSTTMHTKAMPPQKGFSYWDQTTKTIITLDKAPSQAPRRQEVSADRLKNVGRPPMGNRFPPGKGPTGAFKPGMRPQFGVRTVGRPTAPTTQPSAAHKRVVKIEGQITVQRLASELSRKASEVLMKLISMGKIGLNLNTTLDIDEATLLAQEFGHEVENVAVSTDDAIKALVPAFRDDPEDYEVRAPVVTVMGHVDHGKTTLLDAILGMRVAEGEAGGITQKVSAYRVETKKGPVVFFDTPGHEAFTKLRARGAKTTDVAVLVVAADDGVMPTTIEAIRHAQVARVPIVVVLNKIDKSNANPEKVINQLLSYEVIAEEHGGEVLVVPVSAKQRTGIEELVESLALQSEILELKANPKRPGSGTVFDATLDKGRGVVARILVQDGTIRAGDLVLSGTSFGKIRAMFDDRGKPITKAGPSTPVEILGLNEVPAAGDRFHVVADLKKVLAFVDEQKAKVAKGPIGVGAGPTLAERISMHLSMDVSITMGVIIKAEAQASIEALSKALVELSTEKVKVHVIHSGIGGITESDVQLAAASSIPTTVIGFNVRPQGKAQQSADNTKVTMRLYTIIYDAIDEMKALMVGQLKPTLIEKTLGQAEVRQVFSITKTGVIAGCMVTSGKILRDASARLVRDSVEVWKGKLGSLRRFKDDAKEVAQGYEGGIGLEGYGDKKPGDIIDAYEHEEVAAHL